jgi:glyoxylase-like metal-dependent hydrolase (beta-lactamase superfamily II)
MLVTKPHRCLAVSPTPLRDKPSPDASLIADDSFTATSAAGLTYPFGGPPDGRTPQPGEAISVAPGVRWARLPMPGSLGHINTWLLDDDAQGGVAAVDTGLQLKICSDAWKLLFKGDLADQPLSRVVCTHLHPDHIGLAGWLTKRFGVELWMTRGEMLTARMLVAEMAGNVPDEMIRMQRAAGWGEESLDALRKAGWGRFGKIVHPLPRGYRRMKHGDVLDLGRNRWRIVVGSGHSPEHACLLDEENGTLISGDQVLPRISSNVSVNITEPMGDPLGEWLASIDRFLELPDDLLVCPAHGDPFYGLHIRLKALRDEHHARLDRVAAFIREPRRVIDCFGQIFDREITGEHNDLATGEALAHLRRLQLDGRAVCDVRDGVYWFSAA